MHNQSRDDGVLRVGEVVVVDADGSCALTPKSDAFWVTTKVGDVVTDPLKGKALVKETKVLLVISKTCCIRLPENAQTVPECMLADKTSIKRDTLTGYRRRCACRSSVSIY